MPSKWSTIFIVAIFYSILNNTLSVLSVKNETNRSSNYMVASFLNFTELIGKDGYVSEEHRVETEDGYILTAFRIVGARNCRGGKRRLPILLMHGLLQSSDSWIDSGPKTGLAYLISDACHDLWLGNTRGNYYSRDHIYFNPDRDAAFWQFSVDEIGYYDVPAFIDYILGKTKADKLNYIGFSQGAGTFFIMCSERPGYCNKTESMIALAPSTRHLNTKSWVFKFVAKTVGDLENILFKYGNHEILSRGKLFQRNAELLCQVPGIIEICKKFVVYLDSVGLFTNDSVTSETIKTLVGHFPAGTSVHNIAKYGKMLISYEFSKFDYGKVRNLEMYGVKTPPKFNLDAVNVPVLLIYGKNDGVVDVRDIEWLVGKLPRVMEAFMVSDPSWSHLDFTYSQYTNKMIFPKIYEYILKNNL